MSNNLQHHLMYSTLQTQDRRNDTCTMSCMHIDSWSAEEKMFSVIVYRLQGSVTELVQEVYHAVLHE